MRYGHWEFDQHFDPVKYFGFVYEITNNISGKKYIGQKSFHRKQYPWQTYTGSCDLLNSDISRIGIENFSFKILALCISLKELNVKERDMQLDANVLTSLNENGEKLYYNAYVNSAGFYMSPEKYAERGISIAKSVANNKQLLASFSDDNKYEFTNRVTKDTIICSVTEFSTKYSMPLINCIKLSLGHRKLVSDWYITKKWYKNISTKHG